MKKVIILVLVVLFMGCNLDTYSGLEDSWYFRSGEDFTNLEFTDTKLIMRNIQGGISGVIVYDYFLDQDDIYVSQNADFVKAYHIEEITNRELLLSDYGDGGRISLLRD